VSMHRLHRAQNLRGKWANASAGVHDWQKPRGVCYAATELCRTEPIFERCGAQYAGRKSWDGADKGSGQSRSLLPCCAQRAPTLRHNRESGPAPAHSQSHQYSGSDVPPGDFPGQDRQQYAEQARVSRNSRQKHHFPRSVSRADASAPVAEAVPQRSMLSPIWSFDQSDACSHYSFCIIDI
jgi:hypothetical protein